MPDTCPLLERSRGARSSELRLQTTQERDRKMDFRAMGEGLIRQPSIFTLTMEELQNSISGSKDFGSMNMDELLRSIWTAEEAQAQTMAAAAIQRQPSMTLPRTLSLKTVDQVWRDLFKENPNSDQKEEKAQFVERQPTFGEITLEEFLFRAGLDRAAINESSNFYGEGPAGKVTVAAPGIRVYGGEGEEERSGGERMEVGVRGGKRNGSGLERVVERRQKRMIKNRESAARSRARKQAYTMELEAEIVKLKELNAQLQKKQAEFMMKQKNQAMEKINQPRTPKKQCLRRTLTGPW